MQDTQINESLQTGEDRYGRSSGREVLWLKKELLNVAKEKKLEDKGGNQLRGYKALHEGKFLSSWLREGVKEGEAVLKKEK